MFRNFIRGLGGRNLLLSRYLKLNLTNPPRSIYHNREPKKPENPGQFREPKPRFRPMSNKYRVIIIKNNKEDDNYEGLKSLLLVSSTTLATFALVGLGCDETVGLGNDLLKREGSMTTGSDGDDDEETNVDGEQG